MPRWLKGSLPLLASIALTVSQAANTQAANESSKASPRPGWLLLVPPFVPGNPPGPLELQAPLGRWIEMDSTGTAADCDEQRNNMTRMYQSANITSTGVQFALLLYHYAVCVSSADPRLKLRQRGHRLARKYSAFIQGNPITTAYTGPPVEPSSNISPEPPNSINEPEQRNDRDTVLLLLLAIGIMAAGGPLGAWWCEAAGWTLLKESQKYRRWWIATHKEDVSPGKLQKRSAAAHHSA